MKIRIGHLYPDLLNLYGDRGNIQCMKKRCEWRGIEAEIREFQITDDVDFSQLDLVLLGGGSDREQKLVCERLQTIRHDFKSYVEDGGSVLAICGGYELLGDYYDTGKEKIEGLSLVEMYTDHGDQRLISNTVLENSRFQTPIVGFENHAGRSFIGTNEPFGRVLAGFGNNGTDGAEGVLYKNVTGTYLHGPLLPKNPQVCDYLLTNALERRYGSVTLDPLDDAQELEANRYIVDRFVKK